MTQKDDRIDTAVFLDKSLRPAVHLFGVTWALLVARKLVHSDIPLPKLRFLNC